MSFHNTIVLTDKKIKKFINYILTFDNTKDILDKCETQSEKGFIFERLYDLAIKFDCCDIFPRTEYDFLIGNSNNSNLKVLQNIEQYLDEKVISGKSSGCSDITLQHKTSDNINQKQTYL